MSHEEVFIVAAKRTPTGAMLGQFATLTAPQLGAAAHVAALDQANIRSTQLDEVISGCVLQAGIGQAPARQAAIYAQIPRSIGATTINKMCGSGMKATMIAYDLIKSQGANIVLASGMESMSQAPYLLPKARAGYRLGHGELKDHMFLDGLEDAYQPGKLMGYFAERTAKRFGYTREKQDEFATCSMQRALEANRLGYFKNEIVPITLTTKTGSVTYEQDESPNEAKLAKINKLPPAFSKTGTVTAANSSSIADGAASLILVTSSFAKKHRLKPLARILGHASFANDPAWFTTAPVEVIKKLLKKTHLNLNEVDLFEINEAFAVVTLVAMDALNLSADRVNVHGGACALGHPIGASGARILVTLIHALHQHDKQIGVASLCIGGGEATAMAIERM